MSVVQNLIRATAATVLQLSVHTLVAAYCHITVSRSLRLLYISFMQVLSVSILLSSVLIYVEFSVLIISNNENFNLKRLLDVYEEQYSVLVIFIRIKKPYKFWCGVLFCFVFFILSFTLLDNMYILPAKIIHVDVQCPS